MIPEPTAARRRTAPVPDRVAFVAKQVADWVRLGAKPAQDRRIAIVLSQLPEP